MLSGIWDAFRGKSERICLMLLEKKAQYSRKSRCLEKKDTKRDKKGKNVELWLADKKCVLPRRHFEKDELYRQICMHADGTNFRTY